MNRYRVFVALMLLLAMGLWLAGQHGFALGIAGGLLLGRVL